jgi:hypothetical protein
MSGLLEITSINVPLKCVNEVYSHLRNVGMKRFEGVALWAGIRNGVSSFKVTTTIIPKQSAYNHDQGLLYTVDGDELYKINMWLYENKLTLISQIHSHPGAAYHSDTDDAFPIVAVNGGLSIVIPDFGLGEISKDDWAVYRLYPKRGWLRLPDQEVNGLIHVI